MDHKPGLEPEQKRLQVLVDLGLLEPESVPVFEEATQTAAHFLDSPICILGVLDRDRHLFKSAVGLSRIGLMNSLATSRQLPRSESFCTHVIDSQQVLVIPDTLANPVFAASLLVQRYGIRAYLGVPLLTSGGDCIGTLAVMELETRNFSSKEIELLQLTARWSMSEFERDRLIKQPQTPAADNRSPLDSKAGSSQSIHSSAKVSLISEMTQELSTPLTSILGMASVLSQGIYGALSDKQKEYLAIIHNSGQYLQSLVNEIIEIGGLDDRSVSLNLSQVDIEMLCQQAIAALNQIAHRRDQQIQLTIEPGNRIWLLDKDKMRQMLYHLVFCVVQSSSPDSVVRIHVSRRQNTLTLTVWASHPWLGEGLSHPGLALNYFEVGSDALRPLHKSLQMAHGYETASSWKVEDSLEEDEYFEHEPAVQKSPLQLDRSRQNLGLIFSRQLAEMQGGSIVIRGSAEDGYRYVIKLPQMQSQNPGVKE
ncbi:MAG TPA: GAF domain-containing sensor histidine kinase [Coleofasciculaceae cyanobacterium]